MNSADLFRHLQEAIEIDLQRWIDAEGAYDFIQAGVSIGPGIQQREKLIQKTLTTQIENMLIKRGFQPGLYREAQLLNEKRIDFLIQYGFAGPIGLEVKLTSNSDMRRRDLRTSPSYASMQAYMQGYNAPRGIFLVIDNTNAPNLEEIKDAFEQIPKVWVKTFSSVNITVVRKDARKQKTQNANLPSPKSSAAPKKAQKKGPTRKRKPRR